MFKSFKAKFGPMRKAQSFVVYPRNDGDDVVIQSDKTIAKFNPVTGKGVVNFKGSYFVSLSIGSQDVTFSQEFIKGVLENAENKDLTAIGVIASAPVKEI